MKPILLAWFGGFYMAMACVNVITGVLMRSSASAAYAVLMLVMVGNELYSIPAGDHVRVVHALLIAAYLVCVVLFAFTLLRTMRYDLPYARITIGVLALNVILVFVEDLLAQYWMPRFYFVDQLALDALLVMLVVIGARAIAHEGRPIAVSYLIAVAGPAIGVVLNDLGNNHAIPNSLWIVLSFDAGLMWESLFFAFAVSLRNRGIQGERDRFERLAYLDGLTGVANRRTFDETLERMWNVSRRARVPVAIAMVDIDHFKRLNDTRGHQVGDECLRRVAGLCSSVLRRAGDCFARYGGEEFAAILVNVDLNHATVLAESMRRVVERDGGITVSIGVAARVPQAGDRPEILISQADHALYNAKHAGRNCVRVAALHEDGVTTSMPDGPGGVPAPDRRSETP